MVKGTNPKRMVKKALQLIEAGVYITSHDNVLIKPNYVLSLPPHTGVTTDARIVEALIEFSKRCGATSITVGEGGAGDTKRAFDLVGMFDVAEQHGVALVDLNRDDSIEVMIPGSLALNKVRVSKIALNSSCLVNVPKLKVHHLCLASVGMKNLMGTILPKSIMHEHLNEKIVDLTSLLRPKLTVVDGLIASEGDEVSGRPVRMNLIIAGKDVVAVDTVSVAIMGINPSRVQYIKLAHSRGLGVGDLSKIKILGQPIEEVKKDFELPPSFSR